MKYPLQQLVRIGVVTLSFAGLLWASSAMSASLPVEAKIQPDRIEVSVGGQLFTAYQFAPDLKKPYFFPVNGPASGKTVTTETTEPYPHHNSLFFGCDRVNGGDYWGINKETGRIVSQGAEVLVARGPRVVLTDTCLWSKPGEEPILRDHRRIEISAPDAQTRFVDFKITLEPLTEVRIEKSNHSLFAARMLPELSAQSGGTLVDADGRTMEKGTYGQKAPWCAAYGLRDGKSEGLALFQHPQNAWYPSPWFTRDYGFLSPTPMQWLTKPVVWQAGQRTTLHYRVVVFSGKAPEQTRLPTLYEDYTKSMFSEVLDRNDVFARAAAWKSGTDRSAMDFIDRLIRDTDPRDYPALEKKLIALIQQDDATPEAVRFGCRKLSQVGSAASVPALATLLDGELFDSALLALERIGGDDMQEALRTRLPKSKTPVRLSLIHALGAQQNPKNVAVLAAAATGTPAEQEAVLEALGTLGTSGALKALYGLKVPEALSSFRTDALLSCAAGMVENGTEVPAPLFEQWTHASQPDHVRLAAARILAGQDNQAGLNLLLGWMRGDNAYLSSASARQAALLADGPALDALRRQVAGMSPDVQLIVLGGLVFRGEGGLAPLAVELAGSSHETVRMEAIRLLGEVGDASHLEMLMKALQDSSKPVADAGRGALVRLPGQEVDRALVRLASTPTAPNRADLIALLAARGDPASVKVFLAGAVDDDRDVRKASFKALSERVDTPQLPALLGVLVASAEGSEAKSAVRAMAQSADRLGQRERAVELAAKQIRVEKNPAARVILADLLGLLQTKSAGTALIALLEDPDVELRKSAIRSLARWPNAQPARALLAAAARETDVSTHVLAVRGVRDTALADTELSADQRRALLSAALKVARRPEEQEALKKLLTALVVSNVQTTSGKTYTVGKEGLKNGALWASDRDYTLHDIPTELVGAVYLVTVMNDRTASDAAFLTFDVTAPVDVWVGHDHRARSKPAWMKDWEKVGKAITVSNKSCQLELYRKRFPAGKISLGGNTASGASAMYTVAVTPAGS